MVITGLGERDLQTILLVIALEDEIRALEDARCNALFMPQMLIQGMGSY